MGCRPPVTRTSRRVYSSTPACAVGGRAGKTTPTARAALDRVQLPLRRLPPDWPWHFSDDETRSLSRIGIPFRYSAHNGLMVCRARKEAVKPGAASRSTVVRHAFNGGGARLNVACFFADLSADANSLLLLDFDGIPAYDLDRLVTLGSKVRPGFRFVECHRVIYAVPFGERCSLRRCVTL